MEPDQTDTISARAGPLGGLTVLDITRVVAGPFCSMLFADLGATVIKVEHPDEPDYARTFPPFVGDVGEARTSVTLNALAKSSAMRVRTFCAEP